MDAARWNRIEELLQAALDREPGERAAFLTAACGSDAALRREIDELLAHESRSSSFLSRSPSLALLGPREALTGRTISHYRVQAKIGAGGMGEVYEAHDENLRRTVALKVLPEELTSDAERVRRFEQEAFAASRLNHPNIVTIHEILHTDGAHFIAEELIDGKTVRDLLKESGRFPIDRALDVTIQAAEALKAAHTAWIIHRDIKPENIMVRSDGLVKVLDFGIAKRNEKGSLRPSSGASRHLLPVERGEGPPVTAVGAVLGTAKYMSPEQARGEPLDGRTDLFSLGLVFQEMLTGEREGKLDAVPKELQRIVRKLLRTNRDERYSTAGELLDELHRVRQRRESRTARRMVGIGVLAVIVALAVTAIAAVMSIHETWEERVLRDGHTAAARQAIFSPDGSKVISCGEDGQVIVWDFARRERIATLAGRTAYKVAWSPDGRWIATGNVDGSVTIWDAKRFKRVHEIRESRTEIGTLGFSPDSTLLAISDLNVSYLVETVQWRKVEQWTGGAYHMSVVFTPNQRHIVGTNGLLVHDRVTGSTTPIHPYGANWIAASPDVTKIAAIEAHGEVAFYRFDKRQLELIDRFQTHQDHGRAVAWSPHGNLVATAAEDILLWDPDTRVKVARFEYPSIVWSLAFSPDGRWLISTHGDGAILVWDVAERRCAASFNGHSGAVRAVAISRDGRRIASAGEDRGITLWNLESGRKEIVLAGHDTRVTGLAFSPDGRRVASTDQLGTTVLWDVATRQRVLTIPRQHSDASYCVEISPDERFIATTRSAYTIDGREIRYFGAVPYFGQVYGNDYADDGRWLATASTGGALALWDAATYRMLDKSVLRGGIRLITVSASRDGRWIVTGEDQGAVRLWATDPLRHIAILGRHAARVKSVAFAPDGRTAASAGDDGMIALWDVKRRKLLARIGTHASPIYAIAFSPDGKHLVSGEHDRSVRVYTRRRTLWGFEL